jgi:phosphoribosyl-ATP pyrophosphohydrolase/phosphoribosyl-AMP cyclohydrolase
MASNNKNILEKADFEKGGGLIPAVVQDADTGKVLMLGYMNKKAMKQTLKTGLVTFYSRSKKALWQKGETSGNVLEMKSMDLDCDKDAVLVKATPSGPVCHKGSDSCWNEDNKEAFTYLYELEAVIQHRHKHPVRNSYTNKLLSRDLNKIAQKVGEEAVEVVIEATDVNDDLFKAEIADLIYHLSVLLVKKDVSWHEVMDTLRKRRR